MSGTAFFGNIKRSMKPRNSKEKHEAQKQYLDFLRDWMKDKEYIGLAYMTGILPIKKYGTHSALNMFMEFSMENPRALLLTSNKTCN